MHQIAVANFVLAFGATLVLLGILSSLLASRFGTPLLLVFLVVGMLAGIDGPGGIDFGNYRLTYLIGSCALAIILFDGGLRTRLAESREALGPSIVLATVGVAATALLIGTFSVLALGLSLTEGLLLGAIVASTDAAAVFFLLKTGGLQLRPRIGATLEIESGSNDPVAVFLTIVLTELAVAHAEPGLSTLVSLARQAVLGGAMGIGSGLLATLALNRLTLPGGLHPLLAIALTVATFGVTSYLDGSGFLAVYIAGLVVGNSGVRAFPTITKFLESATWMCQIVMFLMLGLLVTPSKLLEYAPQGLMIAAFLMLIGRPAAVWICLKPFGFTPPEINFVSWVGLRGAVSIFLATVPTLAGAPNAPMYFNIAFFVVIFSLLIQGWTIAPAARFFNMALKRPAVTANRFEIDLPGQFDNEMIGYPIRADSYAALRPGSLPAWLKPVMVVRDGVVKNAAEAGQVRVGDYAYFVAPQDRVTRLDRLFVPLPADAVIAAKRTAFGEFAVAPDAALADLATFYEMQVPPHLTGLTVAEAFSVRHGERLRAGSRLKLASYAELLARTVDNGHVTKASLRLEDVTDLTLKAPQLPTPTTLRRLRERLRRLLGVG